MIFALKNEMGYIWYSDHIMDNSFVKNTLDETIRKIPNEFMPIGFCIKPDYSPEKGVGFSLQARDTGVDVWVHVPERIFKQWLKEAAENPEVQPVPMQPMETITPTPAPKRDAQGYIYTKEQAIKNFKEAYQKEINNNTYSYAGILTELMEEPDFSKEKFDADVNKMMKDPYSSPVLTTYFEDYRTNRKIGVLMVSCVGWLGIGGDDGKVANRTTK